MGRDLREQVIDRILDAAVAAVLAHGVDDVQITQIAARAGLSTRTLNRYYPEKDALIAEAASKYLRDTYETFAEAFDLAPKDGLSGLEQLLLLLRSQRDFFKTKSIEAMLMIDLRFYRIRHANQPAIWSFSGEDRVREIVLDCLAQGRRDGSIRADLEPALTSALISSSYNGVMQRLTMVYFSQLPEEKKESIYTVFDQYIQMAERYLSPR